MFNLITRPVDVIPRMATEITENTEERLRLCDLCALCGYQVNRLATTSRRALPPRPCPSTRHRPERASRAPGDSSLRANGGERDQRSSSGCALVLNGTVS